MVGVTGSIPVAPTIPEPQYSAVYAMSPAEIFHSFKSISVYYYLWFQTGICGKSVEHFRSHFPRAVHPSTISLSGPYMPLASVWRIS